MTEKTIYFFKAQENMTHEEVVSILSYMIDLSMFNDIPKGAERHFYKYIPVNIIEDKKSLWDKIRKFIS
jgi:hypothetical protein